MDETTKSLDAIQLPERCGLSVAQDLIAEATHSPEGKLTLDASMVVRMSAPAVMALASAAITRAATGGAVVVRAPTPAFTEAFADLGMFEQLMTMEFVE